MKKRFAVTASSVLLSCLAAMAHAQSTTPQAGDPARWYQADTTPQAQLRTLHKEIAAALGEAKKACRQEPPADRSACLKTAQETYRQDMANAQALRDAAHPK
ncbi:hypothetical protein [Janthinobacterium psychrotolerans]|uniref:UrcA family protein n=1 Tax=Janthinobacterium psychrotolerans TaxID=1747903 RepID=A0A1A7C783_9BURK|nr:hypothetical protein [Janthinobacterium psychrotolerans]OBV40178.1 hypothetical protein ASR47_101493 [Janthinobacterium psychrotolerans]